MNKFLLWLGWLICLGACSVAPQPPMLVTTPTPSTPPASATASPTAIATPTPIARAWYLDAIRMPIRIPSLTQPVPIAIIDTGIDQSHPGLKQRSIQRVAIVTDDEVDPQGHGTHTAGIIAADDAVSPGICTSCPLIDVQAISAAGYGSDSTVAAGIRAAVDAGARVINLSIGGSGDSQVMQQAIAYATAHDVLLVAAAGNQHQDVTYPAAYPEVLAVSAVDAQLRRASFAHPGAIVAPGVGIRNLSTLAPGIRIEEGTSTAAPQVSAAAGIVRALRPDLNATQVRELILLSAQDLGAPGYDDEFGYGMLDVSRLIRVASDPRITTHGEIRGHLSGDQLSDIRIELVDHATVTPDEQGNFRFSDLPAGTYHLQIIGVSRAIISSPIHVSLSGINLSAVEINGQIDWPYATWSIITP